MAMIRKVSLFIFLLLSLIVKICKCERRITNSSVVTKGADTSFVVYIVKAVNYTPGWLCGGTIIHPSIVLTSASCLESGPKQMYVIPGYTKYVNTENIKLDICTMNMNKKITSYCLHSEYGKAANPNSLTAEELKFKWTKYDIGIARTHTPIDFFDSDFLKYCSYLPSAANVNYNSKYEESSAHVVVFGWGHTTYYRPKGDNNDYNSPELRYASSVILPRHICKEYFESEYLRDRIGNNYICASGVIGNFDAFGKHIKHSRPLKYSCDEWRRTEDLERKGVNKTECFSEINSTEKYAINETLDDSIIGSTRRNGICQNDHGNPLVLWIGGLPYVVGVGSAFLVNKKMQCVSPYLYTSVSCTSLFIHCILREQNTLKIRRAPSYCDEPAATRGFHMEETDVDWSEKEF